MAELLKVDGLHGKSNWFAELGTLWPGQAMCLEYNSVLLHERSKYQDVLMLDTTNYGKVLVLDGVIQVTERDQFAYAEMLAHLPLFAHDNPQHVVLIGGGDGAVLGEIVKHKSVEKVTICEIDEKVIAVSKQHYPQYASIWSHPKVDIVIGDGAAYLEAHKKKFDVVIVDSSDPVGPADSLFQEKFFASCKKALKKNGVLCTQGECMWLHLKIIKHVTGFCKKLFPSVSYAYTTIPTYPSGSIGFVVCSKRENAKLNEPSVSVKKAVGKKQAKTLRYYTSDIHRAAFVLPRFVEMELE